MNLKSVSILSIVNFLLIIAIALWLFIGRQKNCSLEQSLEEIVEKNPHFLVSLLNKSANEFVRIEEKNTENQAFERRQELIDAGFCVKSGTDNLIIFADMADANSLMYLKNVEKVLNKLKCSVYIIPISIFGEKSTRQAQLIVAASSQNPRKALQLALAFNTMEDAQNNTQKEAKKLGLNFKKLLSESNAEKMREAISSKTQLAETLGVSAPSIFLIKKKEAYILPPAEADDLVKLIDNPELALDE